MSAFFFLVNICGNDDDETGFVVSLHDDEQAAADAVAKLNVNAADERPVAWYERHERVYPQKAE